ncbi:MAG: phosphatidylglycerophosphatase A [Halieaceae bacterium]
MTISQTDAPNAARAQIDGLATLIASGLGSGLSPFAPGTVGSLFTALCLLPSLGVAATIHWWAWSGAVCVAIWSAEEAGRRWGVADHPAIVIDEVVGLWLAVLIPLTLIPLPIEHRGWLLLGAFALFRVFDIAKPWPVSLLERSLPGGWGVVADDLMAGVMAGLCLTLSVIVLAAI